MPSRIPSYRPPWLKSPQQAARQYDATAERKADKAFYKSLVWKALRAAFLAVNPLCADCYKRGRVTPANHVHHVIDRKVRPDLALEWTNLESTCRACHNAKRAK